MRNSAARLSGAQGRYARRFGVRLLLAAAVAVACAPADLLAQGTQPISANSVVKLTCRQGGKEWRGTGFAWSRSTYIVTALHVVAGCTAVEVHSEGLGKGTAAKLPALKVLRASDLALIELRDDIGLAPVKTGGVTNRNEEHRIWGYPRGVKTMQGDEVRFSEVLLKGRSQSILADLFDSRDEYLKVVGAQGFPDFNAAILRIGSIIQQGHSGGPIFNAQGVVVGIGDGGLHAGTARINWAIPATELEKLLKSSETPPTARPQQVAHFSVEIEAPDAPPLRTAAGDELQFAWSAPLGDILDSESGDDAGDAIELIEQAKEEEELDLRQAVLEIYEDLATGATLVVPEGVSLEYDAARRFLKASTDSGRVTMYVRVADDDSDEAMAAFDEYLQELADWQPDPDSADEEETDPDEGYRHLEITRVAGDDPDDPEGLLYAAFTVDGESFLGTALVVSELGSVTKEDLRMAYLMQIAVELSDFAVN